MPNRLAGETSPYLLQHANNPVDWSPWDAEALAEARRRDVPILLSIGYAACHWCHVMERESFEDPAVAEVMNARFVPVKVDREERPDLDAIYMDAVQAMTGRGGWPMTMFLAPDGRPFYGGTYYPPEDRHGLPAFRRVLDSVHDAWTQRREQVMEQGAALIDQVSRASMVSGSGDDPADDVLHAALDALSGAFDEQWGGFGGAPKFPQPMTVEFLLRMHARGSSRALDMARRTLDRMARGGMFDQVGGGFHRYSVDRAWLVPHFEKMLYDNGQLLRLYTRAWLVTGDDLYRHTALTTAGYLLREMRHPSGGFFSSQDADSEGVEGKYYVWSFDEVRDAAGEDAIPAAAFYGAAPDGNWEGVNVLWRPRDDDVVAVDLGLAVPDLLAAVDRARARLFDARARRVRPATDDKVLASWNGLAISGLAEAGRVFGRDELIAAAAEAARFVLTELRDPAGRLLRSWRDGRTSGPAFLDDHALMASACVDLYETTFDEDWFFDASRLASDAVRLFADDAGGFFDTGSDAERLVIRPKDVFDNAVPSGNAAMAEVLLRLSALTGESSGEDRSLAVLRLLAAAMARAPTGFGYALGALDLALARAKEIAISTPDRDSPATRRLAEVVWRRFPPNRVMAVGDTVATSVPLLRERPPLDGEATAFVCHGFVCDRPVTDPAELSAQLG